MLTICYKCYVLLLQALYILNDWNFCTVIKKKTCIMYGGGVFIICDVLLIGSQKMSGEAVKKEKNAWSILWTTAYYEIKSDLFANYYFFIWYSYLTVWIREPSKSNSFIFCKWRYYCNVIIPKQWWLSRNW